MNTITIATITTGKASLLTQETVDAIKNAECLILKTDRHPIVNWLQENEIEYETLDSMYEQAETFDSLNAEASAYIIQKAHNSHVVFAVPDPATDMMVSTLNESLDSQNQFILLPGISHAERCLAMEKPCKRDLRQTSSEEYLTGDDLSPNQGLFLSELHTQACAGSVKIKLMRLLDDETKISYFTGDANGDIQKAEISLFELDRQQQYDHLTAIYYHGDNLLKRTRYSVDDLREVMRRLRSRDGCPWDQEQTHESLLPNLLEESYEYIEAVHENDKEHMCEELGDILLQIVFHAEIARQQGDFDIHDVSTMLTAKLIERHPHVFGAVKADTASEVLDNWEQIKRKQRGIASTSEAMNKVSTGLTPAMRASKVQGKAAKVGFDFPDVQEALEKVLEEYHEILDCLQKGEDTKEEIGDLLFSVINVCRLAEVDPDIALHDATGKFIRRFQGMEKRLKREGKSMDHLTLKEMDVYWLQEKRISQKHED